MKALVGFFKLVRPVNLFIIVFTMVAMRWGVINGLTSRFEHSAGLQLEHWKFGLSVLVMVLLAAAGNIINDYFDVRVDRINKPQKVIIGKEVKRRVAMITHHAFNAVAVFIGCFLAFDSGKYWIGLVPIVMGTLLWYYSIHFKKAPWVGNFVVALMVAVVPLWSGVFEIPLMTAAYEVTADPNHGHFDMGFLYKLSLWAALIGFSLFAFWLTLIREVIKDLEDFRGDYAAGFRTLPIVWGKKKSKVYVAVLYLLFFLGLMRINPIVMEYSNQLTRPWQLWAMLGLGVIVPSVFSLVKVMKAKRKVDYTHASTAVKVVMAFGILSGLMMYFWH